MVARGNANGTRAKSGGRTVPAAPEASLRTRLTTALDRNKQLADANARLCRQLAHTLGDQRSARTRSGNDPKG